MDSLSSDERDRWQETGDLPDRVSIGAKKTSDVPAASSVAPETPADSSPAQPEAQAAATAASPDAAASEAVKPAGKSTEKGAKARNAELDAEIAGLQDRLKLRRTLRDELATLDRPRTDAKSAESSTAKPSEAEWKRYMAMADAPKEENFERFGDFTAAAALFITDQRMAEHQTRASADAAVRSREDGLHRMGESATARIQEFAKANPGFDQKVSPELLAVPAATFMQMNDKPVGPQHVLAEEVLKSEHTGPLLLHFSTPEGAQDWARLCRLPNRGDLLRAFGRLEARFDGASASTPAPKTVSSAPTPPVTLGTRTADTADPMDAAIKRKDTAAYIREANRRDLAAMGL